MNWVNYHQYISIYGPIKLNIINNIIKIITRIVNKILIVFLYLTTNSLNLIKNIPLFIKVLRSVLVLKIYQFVKFIFELIEYLSV